MRRKNSRKVLIWSIAILLVQACGLPFSTPSPAPAGPSVSPGMLQTSIVQTAAVAQTQTSTAVLPSPTLNVTITPSFTPSSTPTPVTETPTFFFSIFTETSIVIPSQTLQAEVASGAGGSSGSSDGSGSDDGKTEKQTPLPKQPVSWKCSVESKTPGRGFTVDPHKSFYATWTVINKGTKSWTSNTIDFVYEGGFRHEGKKIQDLTETVGPGGRVTLKVLIVAPKKEGTYNILWALRVGSDPFCHLKGTFEVLK